jgi:hypothetical protein
MALWSSILTSLATLGRFTAALAASADTAIFALQQAGAVKPIRAGTVSVTHPRRIAKSRVNG